MEGNLAPLYFTQHGRPFDDAALHSRVDQFFDLHSAVSAGTRFKTRRCSSRPGALTLRHHRRLDVAGRDDDK
jgi:hypothetical protein